MKYTLLHDFFAAQRAQVLRLSFDEVAAAGKIALPASALRYPAWWSNDATQHVQAKAWLDAGYRTADVDIEQRRVSFVRADGVREDHRTGAFTHDSAPRHPLLGILKGSFSIDPQDDLTRPALDEAERADWMTNLDRKTAAE